MGYSRTPTKETLIRAIVVPPVAVIAYYITRSVGLAVSGKYDEMTKEELNEWGYKVATFKG